MAGGRGDGAIPICWRVSFEMSEDGASRNDSAEQTPRPDSWSRVSALRHDATSKFKLVERSILLA